MRSLVYLRRHFSTTGALQNRSRFAQPEESTYEENNRNDLNDRYDRYQKNFNSFRPANSRAPFVDLRRKPAFGDAKFGKYQGGFSNNYRSSNSVNRNLQKVDWDQTSLGPIVKNHYEEHQNVTSRTQQEIDDWIGANKVTMRGKDVPRPVFSFEEANFNEKLLKELSGFQNPTSIQSISWPVLMRGLDIISIAQTGSGKTLAYMLPAIEHVAHQNLPARHPRLPTVLVLVPTRELAQQVTEVSKSCIKGSNLRYATLFGGVNKFEQEKHLSYGVDIVVATPGRLLDHLNTRTIDLRNCSYVVLDEADRMLDMGFEPQVRSVLSQIRPDRQTAMFSATWPKEVQQLAQDFLKNEVFLNVGSLELSANPDIKQIVEVVDERDKRNQLKSVLEKIFSQESNKTLIFVQTKVAADRLATFLNHFGHKAFSLHGNKTQLQRDTIMQRFRKDDSSILIATDVAARGLDVDDIGYVINYDYPNTSADYVHRIGRTGRAGRSGIAYSFVTPDESHKVSDLIEVLQEAQQEIPRSLLSLQKSNFKSNFKSNKFFR